MYAYVSMGSTMFGHLHVATSTLHRPQQILSLIRATIQYYKFFFTNAADSKYHTSHCTWIPLLYQ